MLSLSDYVCFCKLTVLCTTHAPCSRNHANISQKLKLKLKSMCHYYIGLV